MSARAEAPPPPPCHMDETHDARTSTLSLPVRLSIRAVLFQFIIWSLVITNLVQVIRRPYDIGLTCVLYGNLALHALAWVRLMLARRLVPPDGWQPADTTDCERDKKTDDILPPRSRRVHMAFSSHRVLVLGFDHYCAWLGVPIGLHNRRFFVQYLGWGASLCGGASCASGARLLAGSMSAQAALATFLSPVAMTYAAYAQLAAADFSVRALAASVPFEAYLAVATAVMGCLLWFFFMYNVHMLVRNTTSLCKAPRYDVGAVANVQQVMGARPVAWFLPTSADGGAVDGVHYPLGAQIRRDFGSD